MRTTIILLLLVLFSCNSQNKIERAGEPAVYGISSDDKEMNMAIEKARETIEEFLVALEIGHRHFQNFAIKIPVETESGKIEHIWLSYIENGNNDLYGIVDNLPSEAKNIKIGERVRIDKSKISDWMFTRDGKLVGGYTIRVLRNRMTEQEKKEFDKDFSIKID